MFKSIFMVSFLSVASSVFGNFDTTINRVYKDIVGANIVENSSSVTEYGIQYTFNTDLENINRFYFDSSAEIGQHEYILYHYASIYDGRQYLPSNFAECYIRFDYTDTFYSGYDELNVLNTICNYSSTSYNYLYFYFDFRNFNSKDIYFDITYVHNDADNDVGITYFSHFVPNINGVKRGNYLFPVFQYAINREVAYTSSNFDIVNVLIGYGNSLSYSTGYDTGYDNGYLVGYTDGQNSTYSFFTLFTSIADTPIYFVRSMFNFDLFGYNVGFIIMSLLTGLVIFYIIRKIL